MAVDDEAADIFAIPDFWKSSSWLAGDGPTSSFFSLDLREIDSRVKVDPILTDDEGFFRQPAFASESQQDSTLNDEPTTEEESEHCFSEGSDSILDLWLLDEPREKVPEYKSWDTFGAQDAPRLQALYVTEAGPNVYDALLGGEEDPLDLKNGEHAVVNTKTYFSALMAVAVGRESVLFTYDAKVFKPVLPKMRISGYSGDVLRGIQDMSVGCGAMFRRLRKLVDSTYTKHPTPVRVALASALDTVLGVIEATIAVEGRQARSLLQLQLKIRGIFSILREFDGLVGGLRSSHTDDAILSLVFRRAMAAEYKDVHVRDTMREVLQRVSRPWLDFMEEWIGTRPETGIRLTKNDVGLRKCFVKVDSEMYVDDFGQEVEDVDFRLDRESVPEFIPDDILDAIFETGKNLRFIKASHPNHPLARQENVSTNDPPRNSWLYDWDSILRLENRVADYQASLASTLSRLRAENDDQQRQDNLTSLSGQEGFELRVFGADASQIEHLILSSIQELGEPLRENVKEDKLKVIVKKRLSGGQQNEYEDRGLDFSPHWSLLPALSFGPIVMAHARIVNRESLRLLFTAHDLRGHLRVQRQFHLFGNGMFCSRLSHALFDPDLETAERQPGVARQGGVMGLRLSGRDNWPPASSELRLALMGILAESYASEKNAEPHGGGSLEGPQDLPGDLSFSVRDMSPENVDKCMDQDALEALDFLRLSYKPPPALASIFTPVILVQYDRVFKVMLRVLRLVYVINQLFQDINSRTCRWYNPSNAAVRFCFEARHFVHSIASYFVDVGISKTWRAFEFWLDKVEKNVVGDDDDRNDEKGTRHSPERLRLCHSLILDHIMHALLLRKRQQPVLALLEEIFTSVLQFAKRVRTTLDDAEEGPEVGDLYGAFRKKVEVFITVCRGLAEKGDLGLRKEAEEVMDDVQDALGRELRENSNIGYLLMKLDMFNYYWKGTR
ncbi:Gamma-tubulin complex component gcp6 [Scedosporium apiospermum]|uniref:Spindle pole body component n=1 Tax=Pseudallescheria apiosperma TaxID=563466 RepID=A0A084G181_PSEDA|nr:Gamma-tubulin complex component gcp6 [Scedosporium apiospermum]KEZ41093.1 Gamma-tubulin complex component gcp6 [Scedosporium apiospermum]